MSPSTRLAPLTSALLAGEVRGYRRVSTAAPYKALLWKRLLSLMFRKGRTSAQ